VVEAAASEAHDETHARNHCRTTTTLETHLIHTVLVLDVNSLSPSRSLTLRKSKSASTKCNLTL